MPMKLILTGYTGYAQIDWNDILMTSFSVSMNENVIQSGGVGKILLDVGQEGEQQKEFNRYKMNAVRDYPSYDISISCDANYKILDYFLSNITTGFHSFIDVSFTDPASGIYYDFDKCILTSLQLGVSNNATASLSFGFTTFKDDIEVEFGDNNPLLGRHAPKELVGDVLMPYWAWGVEYPDFAEEDLVEFSVSYSQSVTPKFGCEGMDAERNAVGPMKIIVGVPEAKYELTYIVEQSTYVNNHMLLDSNKVSLSRKNLVVKYHQEFLDAPYNAGRQPIDFRLSMGDCYPDSYSPQYGNGGDVNRISISGTVYGKIEYK